ncbi:MAG: C2H2-type zinc finger protein [Cytophagaceae bacterium]|nr:MAG: C2H2-type zinc finger protein [Cytophagaceae bacterium]
MFLIFFTTLFNLFIARLCALPTSIDSLDDTFWDSLTSIDNDHDNNNIMSFWLDSSSDITSAAPINNAPQGTDMTPNKRLKRDPLLYPVPLGRPKSTDSVHRCGVCGSTFKRSTHRKRHVNVVHRKTRDFKCTVCGKPFARQDNLDVHVKTHAVKKKNGLDQHTTKNGGVGARE